MIVEQLPNACHIERSGAAHLLPLETSDTADSLSSIFSRLDRDTALEEIRVMTMLILAAVSLVRTHFFLSHPIRQPLVKIVGEATFQAIYSIVAVATLIWMRLTYRATAPHALLWPVRNIAGVVATAVMLLASILLVGSFIRNPALPTGGCQAKFPETARGVFAITSPPMM